jgi:hypothetical protein
MKKYELQYTVGDDGVFCMSLVENPATKTQLVMFDDESKLLQFQDDDKQIVYSVAMRPNMLIPRIQSVALPHISNPRGCT